MRFPGQSVETTDRQNILDEYRGALERVLERPGADRHLLPDTIEVLQESLGRIVLADLHPSGVISMPANAPNNAIPVLPVLSSEDSRGWHRDPSFSSLASTTTSGLKKRELRPITDEELPLDLLVEALSWGERYYDDPGNDLEGSGDATLAAVHAYYGDTIYTDGADNYELMPTQPLMCLFPKPELTSYQDEIGKAVCLAHELTHIKQIDDAWGVPLAPLDATYSHAEKERQSYGVDRKILRLTSPREWLHRGAKNPLRKRPVDMRTIALAVHASVANPTDQQKLEIIEATYQARMIPLRPEMLADLRKLVTPTEA